MVRKLLLNRSIFLGVAQLVARSVRDAEAVGSSPITQTIFLWLQKKQIELGTGASQGANGSSPTCGSTSKNNRECLHSCFVFRVEERCYYTYDFLCKALGLKLKKMGYFG